MSYYQRIRDLREDADKTQKEIADYLGTSPQYYYCYEIGKNEISFERAIMLAKYYNVSLDYLAGLTNNKNGLELSKDQKEILEFISGLSKDERKILKKLFNKFSNAL